MKKKRSMYFFPLQSIEEDQYGEVTMRQLLAVYEENFSFTESDPTMEWSTLYRYQSLALGRFKHSHS